MTFHTYRTCIDVLQCATLYVVSYPVAVLNDFSHLSHLYRRSPMCDIL